MAEDQQQSRSDGFCRTTLNRAAFLCRQLSLRWPDSAPERAVLLDAAREIEALPAAAVSERPFIPEGWKLVPVEPTKHMDAAGCNEDERYSNNRFSYPSESRAYNVWRAMLDAAPRYERKG
jgi:hypothetical protein